MTFYDVRRVYTFVCIKNRCQNRIKKGGECYCIGCRPTEQPTTIKILRNFVVVG